MRKGSITISTNVIVVLIVCMVLLGMLLFLITKGGRTASGSIDALAASVASPARASAQEPLTVSVPSSVKAGDDFVAKVSFYNAGDAEEEFYVYLRCTTDDALFTVITEGMERTIPLKGSAEFIVLGKVSPEVTPGRLLCEAVAEDSNGDEVRTQATLNIQ